MIAKLEEKSRNSEIIRLYEIKKLPATKIASIIGVSYGTVYNILKKNGIKIMQNGKRKYSYDYDFFKIIDSEEKAYMLGFLFADGNVSLKKTIVRIRLAEKDREILEKLSKVIKSNRPLYFFNQQSKYPSWELSLAGKGVCEDLIKLGCVEAKSSILRFPKISAKLKHHFIRGYFDGDGCITIDSNRNRASISICSTPEFNQEIIDYLRKNCNILGGQYNHKNIAKYSEINICGNRQALEFFKVIYKDATIFLERKYNKFKEIKSPGYIELINTSLEGSARLKTPDLQTSTA